MVNKNYVTIVLLPNVQGSQVVVGLVIYLDLINPM